MCNGAYNHTDRKIHAIEESYEVLTATIKYVYQKAEKDSQISKEWIHTELTQVANAAQWFISQVWDAILQTNKDQMEKDVLQQVRLTWVEDALQLLQVANQQQMAEQWNWNQYCEVWAETQQQETTHLAKEQAEIRQQHEEDAARLEKEKAKTEKLAKEQKRLRTEIRQMARKATPSFLQSVLPSAHVPVPLSPSTSAAGQGNGRQGPPHPPTKQTPPRLPTPLEERRDPPDLTEEEERELYHTVRKQIREQRWPQGTSEVSGSSQQVQEDTEQIPHDIK